MAELWLYRLHPRSPFHFGARGVGVEACEEVYHSDSLFSALASTVRELEGEDALKRWLDSFAGDPPFLLSSAFPFAGDVLFFPRPFLPPPAEGDGPSWKWKEVRWLSSGVLAAYLAGDGKALAEARFLEPVEALVSPDEDTGLHTAPHHQGPFWVKALAPRVTVDRWTSSSEVYHCGRLRFRRGCGVFFLVRWHQLDLKPLFERALRCLGDAGIGGERSSGHGQFVFEASPWRPCWREDHASGRFVTLSLYLPRAEELAAGALGPKALYDLVPRSGWISSPEARALRRKSVWMLAEGSVVQGDPQKVRGRLIEVTPDVFRGHPVYRYGLAFPVPVPEGG